MAALKKLSLYTLLLFCSAQLCAQTKPVANYKPIFEKVYLHTDRDLYLAGNDMWFKAYMVNGQTNEPLSLSNNLYVELISPQGDIISRETLRLDNGIGNGDMMLTDSIATGKYRLRAYTNWMRNFGDNFVFEKNIDIVNPLLKAPVYPEAGTDAPANKTSVSLLPEGGSLVEGISSIIAVKAVNGLGNGIKVKGAVISAIGDTVSTFTTDSLGMGLCTLLPIKGQRYRCVIAGNGNVDKVEFPQVLAKGISMGVMWSDTLVNVVLTANDAAWTQYHNQLFWLNGKHGSTVCLRKPLQFENNQVIMRVPKSFFPEGITALTLYDNHGKPFTERLIYVNHPADLASVNVSTDKTAYASREGVSIKLKLSDTSAKANLSMAVIDANLSPVPVENINTYLMLSSELKGNIEHPERYFDTNNANRFKQMDMLLLTQGWRDFVWHRMADTAINLTYVAEHGFDISGRLRQKFANNPITNTNIVLTISSGKQKMYLTKTDSLGNYKFSNIILRDSSIITVSAYTDKQKRVGLMQLDSIQITPPLHVLTPSSQNNAVSVDIRSVEKANDKYISKFAKSIQLKGVTIRDQKFVVLTDMVATKFGYPDEVLTVTAKDQDYEDVRDFIIHESKQAHVDVETDGIFFFGDRGSKIIPRLLVNRKEAYVNELNDPEMIRAYYGGYYSTSMKMVDKVVIQKVLRSPEISINQGAGYMSRITPISAMYVINLYLKPGALESPNLNTAILFAPGYYRARTFYKPQYDKVNDLSQTDLRSTIHWEPNISINKNSEATVNFYNADPKSKMRVLVQGITDKGTPVVASVGYEVK